VRNLGERVFFTIFAKILFTRISKPIVHEN